MSEEFKVDPELADALMKLSEAALALRPEVSERVLDFRDSNPAITTDALAVATMWSGMYGLAQVFKRAGGFTKEETMRNMEQFALAFAHNSVDEVYSESTIRHIHTGPERPQ